MSTAHVSVLSPPRVSISGEAGHVTVKAGSRLHVRCSGEGVPAPAVSWWRGESMVTGAVVGGAVLALEQVETRDAGQYTCRADNGVGETASESVSVNVLAAPTIQMSMVSGHRSGCSVEISCHVTSSSPATLSWWFNGLMLDTVSMTQDDTDTMLLDLCTRDSVGVVFCEVENMLGLARDKVDITRSMVRESIITNRINSLPLVSSSPGHYQALASLLLCNYFLFKL